MDIVSDTERHRLYRVTRQEANDPDHRYYCSVSGRYYRSLTEPIVQSGSITVVETLCSECDQYLRIRGTSLLYNAAFAQPHMYLVISDIEEEATQ